MSEDEYDSILRSQNYLCAICEQQNPIDSRTREPKILGVDHNHRTGANRGLLCDMCNLALGSVNDSQELLLRLLFYLRKHDGPSVEYIPDNPYTRASKEAAWQASFVPDVLPADGANVGEITASEVLSLCEQVQPSEFD